MADISSEAALTAALDDVRAHPEPIPEYADDVPTARGRRQGKTKQEFFLTGPSCAGPSRSDAHGRTGTTVLVDVATIDVEEPFNRGINGF